MLCNQTLKTFNKQKAEGNMWFNSSISLSLSFIWLNGLMQLIEAPGGSWTQPKISVCWKITAVAPGTETQLRSHSEGWLSVWASARHHFLQPFLHLTLRNQKVEQAYPVLPANNKPKQFTLEQNNPGYINPGLNAQYYVNDHNRAKNPLFSSSELHQLLFVSALGSCLTFDIL